MDYRFSNDVEKDCDSGGGDWKIKKDNFECERYKVGEVYGYWGEDEYGNDDGGISEDLSSKKKI